jgi:hypothetical protein
VASEEFPLVPRGLIGRFPPGPGESVGEISGRGGEDEGDDELKRGTRKGGRLKKRRLVRAKRRT